MAQKRRAPADQPPADKSVKDGDLAVLDRDDERDEPGFRRDRVERRDWRGEGVVSTNHTD